MIRLWFHALAWKLISGRPLQRMSRRARRAGSYLRVETLEDRTVTSVLNIQPLAAVSVAGVSYDAFGGPALPRLLQDVQTIEPRTPDLPSQSATIHLRVTLPGSFGDTVPDQNFPSSVVSPVSGTTHYQPPPASFTASPDPDRPPNTVTQPSQPGEIAQPNKGIGQDISDPNLVNATGRPGATAEAQGAPSGPTTSFLPDGGGYDLAYKVYPSNIPDVTVARPLRDDSLLAGSETSEAVPQSRQSARVEIPAARTKAERLPAEVPDGSLLQRFVVDREQAAFTSLVQRYERLVLGVCQRVLGDSHAAQDASQATFLVLARKAGMLNGHRPLAGWLYQVAYHLALRLRAVAARQRRCERLAADGRPSQDLSDPSADIEEQELRQALLEELQRLPQKYRAPLVLCYFEGRTHQEAARAIGLPRGSMAKRIAEALEHLRERLLDRGFLF